MSLHKKGIGHLKDSDPLGSSWCLPPACYSPLASKAMCYHFFLKLARADYSLCAFVSTVPSARDASRFVKRGCHKGHKAHPSTRRRPGMILQDSTPHRWIKKDIPSSFTPWMQAYMLFRTDHAGKIIQKRGWALNTGAA